MTIRSLTTALPLICALGACCCDEAPEPEPHPTDKPDSGATVEECEPASVACIPEPDLSALPLRCDEDIDCDVQHPCAIGVCIGDGAGASGCEVTMRPDGAWCGDGMSCDEAGNCCPDAP